MDIADKLNVLAAVGKEFNNKSITWAVGGSLLLYIKGITDTFQDLDLMVSEKDIHMAEKILREMGKAQPPHPDAQYRTRYFLEFVVEDVDIDVISGFVIMKDGIAWECPLRSEDIRETFQVGGVAVPLQSLEKWENYYHLMGREKKAGMIRDYLEKNF